MRCSYFKFTPLGSGRSTSAEGGMIAFIADAQHSAGSGDHHARRALEWAEGACSESKIGMMCHEVSALLRSQARRLAAFDLRISVLYDDKSQPLLQDYLKMRKPRGAKPEAFENGPSEGQFP
jgi:hypothetical protein